MPNNQERTKGTRKAARASNFQSVMFSVFCLLSDMSVIGVLFSFSWLVKTIILNLSKKRWRVYVLGHVKSAVLLLP